MGDIFSNESKDFLPQNSSDTVNMTNILPYLVTTFSVAVAQQQIIQGLDSLGRGIQKEVQAAKQPIETTLVNIGSSQCTNVKKILGIEYEQVDNKSEPDLGMLNLQLLTPYYNTSYFLGQAARYISLDARYRKQGQLIIFLHGFTDNPSKGTFSTIREAFLKAELNNNVLALDASSLIKWLYLHSTTYIRFIGEKLGETLVTLVNDGVSPDSIHLIGHSLGSHIAGFTGKRFLALTGFKVGRITGLDPAGPCFTHVDEGLRLHPDDASFVDVIHTDAGVFGIADPVGQVDYYPNSGSNQPNCLTESCSHSRAWELYAETIVNETSMPAVRCESWAAFKKRNCDYDNTSLMGWASKPGTTGKFFLQTAEDSPYGLNATGLLYRDNEAFISKVFG